MLLGKASFRDLALHHMPTATQGSESEPNVAVLFAMMEAMREEYYSALDRNRKVCHDFPGV